MNARQCESNINLAEVGMNRCQLGWHQLNLANSTNQHTDSSNWLQTQPAQQLTRIWTKVNMAKHGIAVTTKWQQQFAIACFGWPSFHWGSRNTI